MANKTVLLINFASEKGHHDSWQALFASLLAKNQINVICASPNIKTIKDQIRPIELEDPGLIGYVQIAPKIISPGIYFLSYLRKKFKKILDKLSKYFILNHTLKREITHLFRNYYQSSIKKHIDFGLVTPEAILSIVKKTCKEQDKKIDFIFLMYVDNLSTNIQEWNSFFACSSTPWGGVLFNVNLYDSSLALPPPFFGDKNFKGLCLLDPTQLKIFRGQYPSKYFEYLPDICNSEVSKYASLVELDIIRKAGLRKIILLFGSIESRKNIELFCRCALDIRGKDYFFVIAGCQSVDSFTDMDASLLHRFRTSRYGNTYEYNNFFLDESELNHLINRIDYIFAVYKDFRLSSNMLSKAAIFNKPIIVSKNYLMGRLVNLYKIGYSISENSASEFYEVLERNKTNPVGDESYTEFLKDFNEDQLVKNLIRFINP